MPYTHPPKGGNENTPFPVEIPEGFDSLCVQHAEDPSMNPLGMGAEEAPPEFQYEYYILDPAQVLPQCLVQFEYNPADDQGEKIIICNQCEQKQATVYCEADDAYLCSDCDKEIHSANRLVMKHQRRSIEEVSSFFKLFTSAILLSFLFMLFPFFFHPARTSIYSLSNPHKKQG